LVRWFLDNGANPCLTWSRSSRRLVLDTGYLLEYAACISSISTIDLLIEHGARIDKSFALHAAASKENNIAMMEHLIELGADVNEYQYSPYYSFGGPPLRRAIRSGCVENIRFLLDKGADPLFRDTDRQLTPLEEAEVSAGPEIRELLHDAAHLRVVDSPEQ
jgi:ankyrin repeat protein